MKIQSAELAKQLNKIKGVVPKKTTRPVLKGILVKEGYLIANNLEMTVKAKLEGAEGECFIIPERAFDLISNLPDGEVDISVTAKNTITISTNKIKNKYQTMDSEEFPIAIEQENENTLTIKADMLLKSIKRVSYAIPARGKNAVMSSMCLQAAEGQLNFVGLDGRVLAWDKMECDKEFELLIPKDTADKLNSLGLSGDVQIKNGRTGAVFITEGFEVHTRLVEGKYFKYHAMFKDLPLHTVVSRAELLNAMTRAKMCANERLPVRFELKGHSLCLSIKDKETEYQEIVDLQEEMTESLTISFDVRLVLETLKAFDCDNVGISFGGPKVPMIVEAEDSDFKTIVLPVA